MLKVNYNTCIDQITNALTFTSLCSLLWIFYANWINAFFKWHHRHLFACHLCIEWYTFSLDCNDKTQKYVQIWMKCEELSVYGDKINKFRQFYRTFSCTFSFLGTAHVLHTLRMDIRPKFWVTCIKYKEKTKSTFLQKKMSSWALHGRQQASSLVF